MGGSGHFGEHGERRNDGPYLDGGPTADAPERDVGDVMSAGPGWPWQPRPGDRVAGLILIREIGRGGMGVVWQARRSSAGTVAIKFLLRLDHGPEDLADNAPREFMLAAGLTHPHVIRMIDTGVHRPPNAPPVRYIVMSWIEDARPLDEYVQGKSLDPLARLRLFLALASALAHAHQRGIAHLDVKPANVLVDAHGHLHLTDFGIARLVMDGPRLATAGTPRYRAPEQRGDHAVDVLDQRADIWALGVVLHQLMTDTLPEMARTGVVAVPDEFSAPGASAGPPADTPPPLAATDPRLAASIPHLLPGLDALIAGCLQPDRDRRPANATEVMRDCRAVVDATGLATFLGRLSGGRPRMLAGFASLVTITLSLVLAALASGVVLAFTPAPAALLRANTPMSSLDVTRVGAWKDVVVLEFTDATLAALDETVPAAGDALPGRWNRGSWRALHAAALERLASLPVDRRPRTVIFDVFFITPNAELDPGLAAAITTARSAGINVVLGAEQPPAAVGQPLPLSRLLLDAGPTAGITMIDGDEHDWPIPPTAQIDLAVIREGKLLATSIVLEAEILRNFGEQPVSRRWEGTRIIVEPAGWASLTGEQRLEIPFTGVVDVRDDFPNAAALGYRTGDKLLVLAVPLPSARSFDASRHAYQRIWSRELGQPELDLAGRSVFIIDGDHDPLRGAPMGLAGRGLAWSIQAIAEGTTLRLASWSNLALAAASAAIGALLGAIASRHHERRTAAVRAIGGRRRRASILLTGLVLAGALAFTALLWLIVLNSTARGDLVIHHPLPAFIASAVAAGLVLHGPRVANVIGRLASGRREAVSTSSPSPPSGVSS